MGINLGRGLAAGLGTYSKLKIAEEGREEDTRRYEEGKAFKEKQFASQEKLRDMQIRESEGRIKEQRFKQWMNNSMLHKDRVTRTIGAGGLKNPRLMLESLSKNNPGGIQYRLVPNQEGGALRVQYGVFQDNEDGTGIDVNKDTGEKTINWSSAYDDFTGINDDKWSTFVFDSSDPGFLTAQQKADKSSSARLIELDKAQAIRDRSKNELADLAEKRPGAVATRKLAEARTEAIKNPKADTNKQIPLAEFRAAKDRWKDMVTQPEAARAKDFMSKGNYKTRVKLARALKNGNLTKSQLIDRFDQQGITSREFIDEFIENIESASDMELEEIDASKPGFWDSIANWFNSNAEAGH